MTPDEHQLKLDQSFHDLIQLANDFPENDLHLVQHFLRVGEPGLALETFVGTLVENEIAPSSALNLRISQLAEVMEISSGPVREYLDAL